MKPVERAEALLQEALAGADRLEVHGVKDIDPARLFDDEGEDPWEGAIGPDGVFEPAPVLRVEGATKIAGLVAQIAIDDARSGGHWMCSGAAWLRFSRRGEAIASLTWHRSFLRWTEGPWPGDGALTEASVAAVRRWFRAEGFSLVT